VEPVRISGWNLSHKNYAVKTAWSWP